MENPSDFVKYYGYLDDRPNLLPALGSNAEASKTEPDKNTYLVLHDLKGADPDYDYGTHFLFEGHELGAPGVITRINLDADATHRVTVLAIPRTKRRPLQVSIAAPIETSSAGAGVGSRPRYSQPVSLRAPTVAEPSAMRGVSARAPAVRRLLAAAGSPAVAAKASVARRSRLPGRR